MPAVDVESLDFEGLHLTDADFVAGKDDSTSLSSGTVGEIATVEISEDGQTASYDAVQLGDTLDPTGNSSKGKIYFDLQDSVPSQVADTVQFRFVARDRNSNRRVPLTPWISHRGEDNSDPRLRSPLSPVTRNGSPFYVKAGRVIALEVKDESASVEVSLSDSTFEVPGRGGY